MGVSMGVPSLLEALVVHAAWHSPHPAVDPPPLQGCLQLLQLPPAQRSGQLEAANTLAGLLLYVLLLMVTVAGSEQQAVVLHMAESGLMAAAVDWLVAAGGGRSGHVSMCLCNSP